MPTPVFERLLAHATLPCRSVRALSPPDLSEQQPEHGQVLEILGPASGLL